MNRPYYSAQVTSVPILSANSPATDVAVDFPDMFRQSAHLIDKIFRGSPPSDIPSGLQSALHTRVDCIERCRAANVKSISLHTAEAEVGDSFRYVDLPEQIAVWSVAAHAVLARITPTHRAPNTPGGVTAHPIGNAGLGHFRKDSAVRYLSGPNIHVEHADMRRIVRP